MVFSDIAPCTGVTPIHELGRPFTDANGPALMASLRFDADNKLTDTPMVALMESLASMLSEARMRIASAPAGAPFLSCIHPCYQ